MKKIHMYTYVYIYTVYIYIHIDVLWACPWRPLSRGPKDHINTRILHSGSKAHYEEGGYQRSWFVGFLWMDPRWLSVYGLHLNPQRR